MNDPQQQISQYLLGMLDGEDVEQLANWIKASPEHADQFARAAILHSAIGTLLRGDSAYRQFACVAANADSEIAVSASTRKQDANASMQQRWFRSRQATFALAACMLVGITIAVLKVYFNRIDNRVAAEVQSSVEAGWATSSDSKAPIHLQVANHYELQHGLAKLKFACGTEVVIQAPSKFDIDHNKLRLASGCLVVSCPTIESRQFITDVPGTEIVDLGTEYGVSTALNGTSEVQVFQGKVQLQLAAHDGNQSSPVILSAGHGIKIENSTHFLSSADRTQLHFIRDGEYQLLSRVASSEENARDSHLIQLIADPDMLFLSDMNPAWGGTAIANLANRNGPQVRARDASVMPQFVEGRHSEGKAVHFDKPGNALAVQLPGQFESLTFAAWVKINPETTGDGMRHRGLVLSSGWNRPGQVHWQVKGRGIRLSIFSRGDDVDPRFSTNVEGLQDGLWHLVVSQIEISPVLTITHFIDGSMIYRRSIPIKSPPLTLGDCSIGGWVPQQGNEKDDRSLNGSIDDLMIWKRMLTIPEIASLYEAGNSFTHQTRQTSN